MHLIITLTFLLFSSCGQSDQVDLSIDDIEWVSNSLVGAIVDDLDDVGGQTLAQRQKKIFDFSLIKEALALDYCQYKVTTQTCTNSTQTIDYNCYLYHSTKTLQGTFSHQYSGTNCTLSIGEVVSRSINYQLKESTGESTKFQSTFLTNYQNSSSGGGSTISMIAADSLTYGIIGKNLLYYNADNELEKTLSLESTSMNLNKLTREQRTLSNGTITIHHNAERYSIAITPTNLTWSSTCCYPLSGELRGTISGTYEGEVTLLFTECGQVQISDGKNKKKIDLDQCGIRSSI